MIETIKENLKKLTELEKASDTAEKKYEESPDDIKAEIENKGDHLEVTVTQSNYEDIIGTKQEFFQADE